MSACHRRTHARQRAIVRVRSRTTTNDDDEWSDANAGAIDRFDSIRFDRSIETPSRSIDRNTESIDRSKHRVDRSNRMVDALFYATSRAPMASERQACERP